MYKVSIHSSDSFLPSFVSDMSQNNATSKTKVKAMKQSNIPLVTRRHEHKQQRRIENVWTKRKTWDHFIFKTILTNTQTNEQRVKNAHAGTLINKNVIIPPLPPPTPPHPTHPHPIPPPRTNPGMPTRNYKRNSVKKHSKTRGKCNDAHENKEAREMTWMLRQWRKHEKMTTLRDALAGTLPKTTVRSLTSLQMFHTHAPLPRGFLRPRRMRWRWKWKEVEMRWRWRWDDSYLTGTQEGERKRKRKRENTNTNTPSPKRANPERAR